MTSYQERVFTSQVNEEVDIEKQGIFVYKALRIAVQQRNVLLLEYIRDYCICSNIPFLQDIITTIEKFQAEVVHGTLIRWMDTALLDDTSFSPQAVLQKKIVRILRQIRELEQGTGLICCVIAPALNEEDNIPLLAESLRFQRTTSPVVLVISDNGSTDKTTEVALSSQANVEHCPIKGTSAARAYGLSYVLRMLPYKLEQILIYQSDADCMLEHTDSIEDIYCVYQEDRNVYASIGPTNYYLPMSDGSVLKVSGGKQYGQLFGTKSLVEYIEASGRRSEDYLLAPPYRYMIGPNTVYRASVFNYPSIAYPTSKRWWETSIMSIRLQQHFVSEVNIKYIKKQVVKTSNRQFLVDGQFTLTPERQAEIKRHGYVPTSKALDQISPAQTVNSVLADIDRETYGIAEDEEILLQIIPDEAEGEVEIDARDGRIVVVRHAKTLEPITPRKLLLVGKKGCEEISS